MKKNNIGASHFSEEIVKISNEIEINHEITFYDLDINGKPYYYLYDGFNGYFEISHSFLEKSGIANTNQLIQEINSNEQEFYKKLLAEKKSKFVINPIGSNFSDIVSENNITIKNAKRHNLLIKEIEKKVQRGAKMWFFHFYQNTFFRQSFEPDVYLDKSGFVINDTDKVFYTTTRTLKNNLNKLKSIGLIEFSFSKNTISNLKFNSNHFTLFKENIPNLFHTAFFESNELDKYEPINADLKKVDSVNEVVFENNTGKTDYTKKQIQNELIGTKSEKIALEFELERLKSLGFENVNSIAKIVSEDSSLGYDIISKEKSLEKRHIEVKTLRVNNDNVSFHLTKNELEKINLLSNYYIYIVEYVGNSSTVKILDTTDIENSEYFKIVPTDFKVYIKY
ncbi:hypothetical protein GCM10007962_32760 [Yeosuana aromativorans]|uniref:Protein NO VEIN C-terminal domain-containing protein n=1 Tax=Yeosuana aromativorans TaxID=288019 RepID=A0A8J3BNT0_9FLAO|nr:DUF3883 domain-containing protein [Yeosuana aromativorans]GGK35854.1 hypothetical protein GCM10007962_32760 [Yeosuana aromativorans]